MRYRSIHIAYRTNTGDKLISIQRRGGDGHGSDSMRGSNATELITMPGELSAPAVCSAAGICIALRMLRLTTLHRANVHRSDERISANNVKAGLCVHHFWWTDAPKVLGNSIVRYRTKFELLALIEYYYLAFYVSLFRLFTMKEVR